MLKDIICPEVKEIIIAVVNTAEPGDLEPDWGVYLINLKTQPLRNALMVSKGYGEINHQKVETSIIRKFYEEIPAQSYTRIEPIVEEVFGLNNEYWLSFYMNGVVYDKKFVFLPESILAQNTSTVPIIQKPGIMIGE